MKAIVLGTSASTPAKDRNLSSVLVSFNGRNFLFDCPEGTQRQIMQSSASFMKVDFVFLSHFHADHVLGLPGLLATMEMLERQEVLKIFGPEGIEKKVELALKLAGLKLGFEVECNELKSGIVLKEKNFQVKAIPLKHDTPCFGFVFEELKPEGKFNRQKAIALGIPEGPLWGKLQDGKSVKVSGKTFKPEQVLEKGKGKKARKIAVISDTLATYNAKELQNSDLLIHEASFLESTIEKALERKHCTALQAAIIAKKAKVGKLVLFHLSTRHQKEIAKIEEEARQEFANSIVAKDLMEFEVKN